MDFFHSLPPGVTAVASKALSTLLGAIFILFVARRIQKVAGHRIENVDARYRVRKLVGFGSWMLVALVIVAQFSSGVAGLAAGLGVAGAGVAFALQEVIASLAGWVAIMLGGFYNVGDRVQLGGIKGDVIDIGVVRTTIMETGQWVDGDLYNGRIVRVANSFVFKEPVFNYSGDFPFLWDEVTVPVKYGCDAKGTRRILQAAAESVTGEFARAAAVEWEKVVSTYRVEAAQVAPLVTLKLNDNWMEFTVRYPVRFNKRRTTKDQLFTEILEAFDASGGKSAFASATFHLVEAPPIHVTMTAAPLPPPAS